MAQQFVENDLNNEYYRRYIDIKYILEKYQDDPSTIYDTNTHFRKAVFYHNELDNMQQIFNWFIFIYYFFACIVMFLMMNYYSWISLYVIGTFILLFSFPYMINFYINIILIIRNFIFSLFHTNTYLAL